MSDQPTSQFKEKIFKRRVSWLFRFWRAGYSSFPGYLKIHLLKQFPCCKGNWLVWNLQAPKYHFPHTLLPLLCAPEARACGVSPLSAPGGLEAMRIDSKVKPQSLPKLREMNQNYANSWTVKAAVACGAGRTNLVRKNLQGYIPKENNWVIEGREKPLGKWTKPLHISRNRSSLITLWKAKCDSIT